MHTMSVSPHSLCVAVVFSLSLFSSRHDTQTMHKKHFRSQQKTLNPFISANAILFPQHRTPYLLSLSSAWLFACSFGRNSVTIFACAAASFVWRGPIIAHVFQISRKEGTPFRRQVFTHLSQSHCWSEHNETKKKVQRDKSHDCHERTYEYSPSSPSTHWC